MTGSASRRFTRENQFAQAVLLSLSVDSDIINHLRDHHRDIGLQIHP
ncbi:MAG: hypothetical protein KatS3mg113_0341 [Planctomycetaceae bacterium]|nr:MAG: hypothetical protein KatS3mg113_0341 [Planctomycetaceae bacterium]